MAIISFGKKEIEDLETENEALRDELFSLKEQINLLMQQIKDKDKKLSAFQNYIKQIESLADAHIELLRKNQDLRIIVENPERKSKATTENLKVIAKLKAKGDSYRAISRVLSKSIGEPFSYSTVRYLYKKYIENSEQWS